MLVLLEVEANLISMKLGFDPNLRAIQIEEKSHDTGKQTSQVWFSARTENSNLVCILIIFLKPTQIHYKY